MTKKYLLVADSTTDLPADLAEENGIITLPLKYHFGEETFTNYLDYREQSVDIFYDLVKEGQKVTTSQLNPEDVLEKLEPLAKEGNSFIMMTISSKLSGTYNSVRLAFLELAEKYPKQKFILIDSKSASLGLGYIVIKAAKEKQAGKSLEEVETFINELIPTVAHWFTVDDINHLRRGGRISAAASVVAKTLRIKPVLHCSAEGELIARGKALTRKRAIRNLFEKMEETALPNQKLVYIGHGADINAANELASMIKEKYPSVEILINTIGPVVGAHTGQGVLALFFEADHR